MNDPQIPAIVFQPHPAPQAVPQPYERQEGAPSTAASASTPIANGPAPSAAGPVASWADRVLGQVNKVYVGQDKLVHGLLAALLADGHVLIESVPGLGKTLLV